MRKSILMVLIVALALVQAASASELVLNYTTCNVANNAGTAVNDYGQGFILNASGTGQTNITYEVQLMNGSGAPFPAGTIFEAAVFYNQSVTNASKVTGCSVFFNPVLSSGAVCGSGTRINISFSAASCLLNVSGNYTAAIRIQNEGTSQFYSSENGSDPYQRGHCYACAGAGGFSTRTQVFRIWAEFSGAGKNFTVTNGQNNITTVESKTEQYFTNITWGSNVSQINATLVWNGTEYATSLVNSGAAYREFVSSLQIPMTTNNSQIHWYWNLSVYNISGNLFNDTGEGNNVTIAEMNVSNCTVNISSPAGINFTVRDEITNALISTSQLFGIFDFYTYDSLMSRSQNISWNGVSAGALCMYPGNLTFHTTSTVGYQATGYYPRQYILNRALNSTTFNVTLLLLPANATEFVTFNVVDSSENPLQNYPVEVYLYTVGTGTQTLIGAFVSDVAGQGVLPMQLNAYYIFKVYDTTNTLVLDQGPEFLIANTKTLVVGDPQSVGLGSWLTLYGLDCDMGFNNATKIVSTNWTHNGSIDTFCMGTFNLSDGMSLLSTQCSTNDTGSFTYDLSAGDGYQYFVINIANLSDNTTGIVFCDGENPLTINLTFDSAIFGIEGVFWALIFLLLFAFMGLTLKGKEYIPSLAIVLWAIVVSIFRLIPLTLSIILGVICLAGIWAVAMKRERE